MIILSAEEAKFIADTVGLLPGNQAFGAMNILNLALLRAAQADRAAHAAAERLNGAGTAEAPAPNDVVTKPDIVKPS